MMRRGWLAVGIVTFGAASASTGRAEPEQDPAQILADTASGLVALGNYDEGCEEYERSEALDPTPPRMLNAAECNERRGRTASAWMAFRQALDMADQLQDEASARAAHRGIERVEASLGRIEIVLSDGAATLAGLEVRRDGLVVPPTALGVSVPVDPGKHVVSASAPHRASWSVQLGLARGPASVSITIPDLDRASTLETEDGADVLVDPFAVHEAPASERTLLLSTGSGLPADDGRSPSFGSTQRAVGWLLGGVGVAGITAGTALGLGSDSRFASQARASTALLGLGVTALAAGVVIYITSPPESSRDKSAARPATLAVGPTFTGASLGFGALGSF